MFFFYRKLFVKYLVTLFITLPNFEPKQKKYAKMIQIIMYNNDRLGSFSHFSLFEILKVKKQAYLKYNLDL